ncbi:MAG TPA: hypothetical protein VGC41_07260, partial [Kofleriaceae bacterium]
MGKHDKISASTTTTTHDQDEQHEIPRTPVKRRQVGDRVATASRRAAVVRSVEENNLGMVTYTISYLSRTTGKPHDTTHRRSGYRLLDYHVLAATKLPAQGSPQGFQEKPEKKEGISKEVGEAGESFGQIAEGPEEMAMHLEVVAEREKEQAEEEDKHEQAHHAEPKPEEHKSEDKSEAHEHAASELGIATSGIGAITSGISGVTGLVAFVKNVKQYDHSKSASERYQLTTKALANLTKGGAGIIGAGSRAGRTAGSIASLVVDNDALKAAMNSFSAIGGTVDFIAGTFATIRDGSKTVMAVGKNLSHLYNHEETNWREAGPPMIKTLE